MRRGEHTLADARAVPCVLRFSLTYLSVNLGDDLPASGSHSGFPERTQQASVALLPRGDAEEPAEAAGETSAGGAAENGPTTQAGGGDG